MLDTGTASTFLRNCWYAAAYSHELGAGLLARTLLGEAVLLYRTEAGQPVAMQDRCPHRAVPLSMGKRIGDLVRCSYHGLRIAPDGQCVHIPCQERIPAQAQVRTFPLVDRHTLAWIWMGEPSQADPALIPDVHWFDDPAWAACTGYHRIEAHYQLLTDNLLDLSHESFLHEATIGNEAVARAPVTTQVTGDTVRVHRDILDCEPPPFYVKATGFTSRINRWHTTIFRPPGFNLIENGSYPVGQDRSHALERRVVHIATPATQASTHYFWGIARQYQREDTELTEFIRVQSARTFDEDKVMLEAQQRALDAQAASAFPVALATDAGPIQARRLMQRLIDQESEQESEEQNP